MVSCAASAVDNGCPINQELRLFRGLKSVVRSIMDVCELFSWSIMNTNIQKKYKSHLMGKDRVKL
jgi:hypothetical protein